MPTCYPIFDFHMWLILTGLGPNTAQLYCMLPVFIIKTQSFVIWYWRELPSGQSVNSRVYTTFINWNSGNSFVQCNHLFDNSFCKTFFKEKTSNFLTGWSRILLLWTTNIYSTVQEMHDFKIMKVNLSI